MALEAFRDSDIPLLVQLLFFTLFLPPVVTGYEKELHYRCEKDLCGYHAHERLV